jgi:uncharacterized protein YheU (UPF0270 family)
MKKQDKVEKTLQEFNIILRQAYDDYKRFDKEVNEMDKATQDVLHQLELGEKVVVSKWSRELVNVRKQRRFAKDKVEELKPLYDYYLENQKSINKIANIIGELRAIKKHQSKRVYKPRVIKAIEI